MKNTTNTRPARISRRLWVGINKGTRTVFRHAGTPTEQSTPQFSSVIGPFRTKRGAEYMAGFHGGRSLCVSDAEQLAAIHAGQSALCAAYSAHLSK